MTSEGVAVVCHSFTTGRRRQATLGPQQPLHELEWLEIIRTRR